MEKINEILISYPFILSLLYALGILAVGWLVIKRINKIFAKMMSKAHVEPASARFLGKFIHLTLFIVLLLIVLGQMGVKTASLVAVIGAAGLAIGLALQGSLSNFASGILLVIFKPFIKDDYIVIAGIEGTVEEVGFLATTLRDDFNLKHVIPNAMLNSKIITNVWTNVERRLEFNIGIAYDEDLDQVIEVLENLFQSHPLILEDPQPFVGVRSMDDSSINLLVWVFIHRPNYKMVRFRLYKEMKQALDQKGIVIAFPQCDVHLKSGLKEIAS